MTRERLLATPWPLTLALALFVAVPILAQGELSAAETRTRARAEQLAATARVATQAAAELDAAIARARDQVAAVATRAPSGRPTPLIDALERGDAAAVGAQLETIVALFGSQAQNTFLLDANQTVLYEQPPFGNVGKPISTPTDLARVSASVPFDISPVVIQLRGPANALTFWISAYIPRARDGQPVVISVRMSPALLASETLQPLFASADEIYLVDESGRLILRSSRAFAPDPEALKDLSREPVIAAAMGAPTTRGEAVDPFGRGPRLAASAALSSVGWRVVAQQATGPIERELDSALLQERAARGLLVVMLIVGAFLLSRSASQVLRQRSELAETNRRLAHASAAKSAFLANVSHELRTPMNAILGFTEAVLAGVDGPLNDEQKASLGWVQRGGQDLLGLINEILDLSKIEAGKLVITPEPFDPRELLETVVAQHRSLAAGKGVRLSWRDDELPEQVTLDRQRTRQILVNLVGNAMKFTERGEVEVVGSGRTAGRLQLLVHDTGPGIPADQREAIFEEFRQVEGTVGGSGLGLPISRRLARLMGGEVTVESELGKGSVFHVDLPRDLRVGHDAEIAPAKAGGERLLLAVDDDPSVGPLLEKMLAGRSYRVAAPDPANAVAEARRLRPSVITLDLLMPERSGAEILRELRSDPLTRDIPVISLSVMDAADAPKDVAAHLTKPLRKDRLLRVLDDLEKATLLTR